MIHTVKLTLLPLTPSLKGKARNIDTAYTDFGDLKDSVSRYYLHVYTAAVRNGGQSDLLCDSRPR